MEGIRRIRGAICGPSRSGNARDFLGASSRRLKTIIAFAIERSHPTLVGEGLNTGDKTRTLHKRREGCGTRCMAGAWKYVRRPVLLFLLCGCGDEDFFWVAEVYVVLFGADFQFAEFAFGLVFRFDREC